MPDWSYHTLFRRLFFSLTHPLGRNLALKSIRTIDKIPGGSSIIRIMGHMKPAPLTATVLNEHTYISPVGLSREIDPDLYAVNPLSLFGIGLQEVALVTRDPILGDISRNDLDQTLQISHPWVNKGLDHTRNCAKGWRDTNCKKIIRLGYKPGSSVIEATEERIEIIESLKDSIDIFVVDEINDENWSYDEWEQHLKIIMNLCSQYKKIIWLSGSIQDMMWKEKLNQLSLEGIHGIMLIGRSFGEDGWTIGKYDSPETWQEWITFGKQKNWPIAVSAGIKTPDEAIQYLKWGADFLLLNTGLIYSGPGLCKRINEAIIDEKNKQIKKTNIHMDYFNSGQIRTSISWISGFLIGVCLIISGVIAWLVASNSVVLPYDTQITGISVSEIQSINDRLLHFMSHDRITLSGTMISLGIIYSFLAFFGLRQNLHWPKVVILVSCLIGFGNLFYMIGHGYFDPLHLLLSLFMFLIFVLFLVYSNSPNQNIGSVNRHNSYVWRLSLWGQLCFVVLGFAFCIGGTVISIIGMTTVFVPEDLKYLAISATELMNYPNLVPLIAHDRAGFGGILLAEGLAILLISLWGFREGDSWVWWMLLLGGIPGYLGAIGVHFQIGYLDVIHLSPAYFALLLYIIGLIYSYPFCVGVKSENK